MCVLVVCFAVWLVLGGYCFICCVGFGLVGVLGGWFVLVGLIRLLVCKFCVRFVGFMLVDGGLRCVRCLVLVVWFGC